MSWAYITCSGVPNMEGMGGPYPVKGLSPPSRHVPPLQKLFSPPQLFDLKTHLSNILGKCWKISGVYLLDIWGISLEYLRYISSISKVCFWYILHISYIYIATLHLGFSVKLRIWQVPACKMEPRSGIIYWLGPPTHQPPTHPQLSFFYKCCAVSPPQQSKCGVPPSQCMFLPHSAPSWILS